VTEAKTLAPNWGSDLRIVAVAAMAPLLSGLLVLLGYIWLNGFGVVLGLGAAIGWIVWWRRRNDREFFPREMNNGAFVITVVLTIAALALVLFL
jgi:uncharacterized Tic20 family protein